MKSLNIKKILACALAISFIQTSLADADLPNIGSSITNNANNQLISAINLPLPFVVSVWSMMSNYYSSTSNFPPANTFAVDTSILTNVNIITNTSYGTLEVHYGPNAPGPMANKGYALAPTRVVRKGNIFYIYELTQCFTNIMRSAPNLLQVKQGTNSDIFGNSNLGTNCSYAEDPYAAAINQVEGNGTAPPSDGVGAGVGAA